MLRLQVKPWKWCCLATSFAMALEITTEEFFRLAGHDGSEIAFPWLLEPRCRIGFHVQEAIHVARQLGHSVTPFELFPQTRAADGPLPATSDPVRRVRYGLQPHLHSHWDLFNELVESGIGVIEGQGKESMHAVAYDHGYILNPDGEIYRYSREACETRPFYTQRLWQIK